jgi:exodeoxyribonuclease-3
MKNRGMRIASWNVNSIRPRLEHLTDWLRLAAPDVVCLQETKVEDEKFPADALAEAGYRTLFYGQKAYNGVATLARFGLAMEGVKKNLDGDDDAAPRRSIACTVEGVRIINVYVPNGQAVGTQAFAYKLMWLSRLSLELATHHAPTEPLVLCGDFNVAPAPIDVHDPIRWDGHVLFHADERAALADVVRWGFVDGLRAHHPEPGLYTWWDYRMNAFKRGHGLRIDHALLTRPVADRCRDAWIDRRPRERERPSDHAPLIIDLA